MSSIENKVIQKIQQRAEVGENKYGVTMDRDDLTLHQWLIHLQEELLDGAVYAQKLIEQARDEYEELLIQNYDEEAVEDRMRVIGQNGNTGEHYDIISGTEAAYIRSVYPGDAKISIDSPCVAHSHWSHGFNVGDIVTVSGENFRVTGVSDSNLSLEINEEIN